MWSSRACTSHRAEWPHARGDGVLATSILPMHAKNNKTPRRKRGGARPSSLQTAYCSTLLVVQPSARLAFAGLTAHLASVVARQGRVSLGTRETRELGGVGGFSRSRRDRKGASAPDDASGRRGARRVEVGRDRAPGEEAGDSLGDLTDEAGGGARRRRGGGGEGEEEQEEHRATVMGFCARGWWW